MRLFCKNKNELFDTLCFILNTEEIHLLIPEFEKLVQKDNYVVQYLFEDSYDKKSKKIVFRIYDKDKLADYDEQTKNIISEII